VIVGTHKFRQYVRNCRILFPIRAPVVVLRTPGKVDGDACATTEIKNGVVHIRIWKGMCKQATIDALIHEWVHAWLYDDGHPDEVWLGHSPVFWTAFGEFYRAWRDV